MGKLLKDFTVEEAVNRALGGFGKQDASEHAKFEEERNALHTVIEFKIAENQDKINQKLLTLTKWLVCLSIILLLESLVLAIPILQNIWIRK